ncbi:MAG: ROK family transcriptional regulator [Streptosporangiaceae bacterium]|nr:ROK family transcriptional regulator [Streptosporangiaceae bacterium]MBV9857125.1 ROK family transcriptional regulator [Streptosporangiaceae bacterium]
MKSAEALSPLLQRIAQGSATTRAELARVTRLSRSSVSQRVDALLDNGLVIEEGTAPSSGGRPALRLRINAEAALILVADLGATRARFAVSDLAGAELGSSDQGQDIDQEPAKVLAWADGQLRMLLDRAGRQPADVRAIVVGLPAPVQFATGTAIKPPLMPRWDGYRVPGYFAERYAAVTLVDNDVNLMALGEHRATYPGLEHLLFIKAGTGIGCGIIVSGHLHRGADGAAGDVGHIHVPGCDAPCRCGNTGCLEAVAGGQAMASHLTAKGLAAATARDVASLATRGDTLARQEVRAAAQHIGEVLAAIVSFANPSAIVVGGSLAQLDDVLLSGIRAGIHARALPLAQRSLRIETSTLGERAGTVGAIALAQDRLLSEEGLDHLLRIRR